MKNAMKTTDKLMDFVDKAITEKNTNDTYKVFIGRTLTSALQVYLEQRKVPEEVSKWIVLENGFRLLSQKMAEQEAEFLKKGGNIRDFPVYIKVYADFIVSGAEQAGIIEEAAEIFSKTLTSIIDTQRFNVEKIMEMYRSKVSIHPFAVKSNDWVEYRWDQFEKVKDMNSIIFKLAEYQYHFPSDINAPSLKMEPGLKEEILRRIQEKESLQMHRIKNEYMGRKVDCFIAAYKNEDAVKVIYTLRCTDKEIIPSIFLPALTERELKSIVDSISIKAKFNREVNLEMFDGLTNEYFRFINSLLNTIFLRAFAEEIGLKFEVKDFFKYNYTGKEWVTELFRDILNPQKACFFSVVELQRIINIAIAERYIFKNDVIEFEHENCREKDIKDIIKIEENVEKALFNYTMYMEERVEWLWLHPTMWEYPKNNLLGNILQMIYAFKDSWMRRNASIETIISYILQFIDLGCIEMKYCFDGNYYIPCLKFYHSAKNNYLYRYAHYMPLLHIIETRLRRYGLYSDPSFLFEYYRDFFREFDKICDQNSRIDDKRKLKILWIFYKFYKSRISVDECLAFTEIRLEKSNKSYQEYLKAWMDLYDFIENNIH